MRPAVPSVVVVLALTLLAGCGGGGGGGGKPQQEEAAEQRERAPNRGRNNTPSSRRWRLLPFRTAVMLPMTRPSGSIHPIPHAARSLERTSWAESQSMTGLAPSFSTATKTQHITTSIFAPTSRSETSALHSWRRATGPGTTRATKPSTTGGSCSTASTRRPARSPIRWVRSEPTTNPMGCACIEARRVAGFTSSSPAETWSGRQIDAEKVRSFGVDSLSEGCVADDEMGHLYLAEEEVGIWKYPAEPNEELDRLLVDAAGPEGPLVADVEGLAIAYGPNGTGYLLASSQGNSSYTVYRREGSNAYLQTFTVGDGGDTDGTTDTDGIDVSTASLGSSFPSGLFVAQDGTNTTPSGTTENQNYKLVPLQHILEP